MASEQLQTVIKMLSDLPVDLDDADFAIQRKFMEKTLSLFPLPEDLQLQEVDADGVPCEWTSVPSASHDRTLLYLHGGGYVLGSVRTHRAMVGNISSAAGLRCLSVDYRLAPEHPHPAAVDDARTAYRWLLSQGLSPEHLAIAGDSAGGGLTAAILVALREAGDPLPAAGVMLSPWVDLEGTGDSMIEKAEVDPTVRREGLLRMANAYLGDLDPRTPLAAPLHADLSGLPPLLIQAGTAEMLLDDATRLAENARKAGVEVTLEVWEDMFHVFQAFAAILPEGREAIMKIGSFLKEKLN